MKKIIEGKLYNTETASLIAEYWNGCSGTDFNVVREYLYQKKTKEYFLYGTGGPFTEYSEQHGNHCCYGETIIPLTEEEAKKWCSKRLTADEYINIFGEVEE